MKIRNKCMITFLIVLWIIPIGLVLSLVTTNSKSFKVVKFNRIRAMSFSETRKEELPESILAEEVMPPVLVAEPLYGEELYRFYIAQVHEQYYPDVDPYIALAVLEMESNYQSNVKSSAGAVGLMQVLPCYHAHRVEKYGLNDLWDPYTNIICGMDFLNDLIHQYGTWNRALLGYNNSTAYVAHVLTKAESLRGGGYFG